MACTSSCSPTFIPVKHPFSWPHERRRLLHNIICLNNNNKTPKSRPWSSIMVQSLTRTDDNVVTNYEEDDEIWRIKRLQNGSDIRGVALKGEKGRTVDLTPPAVEAISESFGDWLKTALLLQSNQNDDDDGHDDDDDDDDGHDDDGKNKVSVSLGRDPRVTGAVLSAAVFAGLGRAGCVGFDLGLATTPACFMSTVFPAFSFHASIMMTASHLPYTRNGLKFFTKRGGLTSVEVEEVCDRAARKYANRQAKVSLALKHNFLPKKVELMAAYSQHLRDIIKQRINHPTHYDTPLQGFQIIVNAGNGSGGFFTWDVLDKLGADTFGSLHLKPDGMFPNHIPNPEDKTAMSMTRAAVLENSADLGIVFDTDVDRSGVVDDNGNPINGDKLIALMSAIVLKEHPLTTIVTDARTSIGLSKFIISRGGKHCLYRVGYRNVIDKGVHLNTQGIETHLMMETSGHGALKENFFLDDGAYMVVKIIIEMVRMRLSGTSQGVGSLIEELEDPVESVELRMDVVADPKYAKSTAIQVIETFRTYVEEDKLEGWVLDSCGDCWVGEGCLVDLNETPTAIDAHMYRVKVLDKEGEEQGWVHLRQSVHNPNIAVNMQSSIDGGCHFMTKLLRDKFLIANGFDKVLDLSDIERYVKSGNLI